MTMTLPPAAPSRASGSAFSALADAFISWLANTHVPELNVALGAVNITKWVSGTTYAIGDCVWSPVDFQGYRRKTAGAGATDPSSDATNWQRVEVSANAIQSQSYTSFTTGGTGTAFTLTPSPAITAYAAGQSFWVTFHAAAGASPTLQISGLASPPALVKRDSTGAYVALAAGDFAANHRSRVTLLSATQALVEELAPLSPTWAQSFSGIGGYAANQTLTASDYGKLIYVSASPTITLPVATAADVGKSITLYPYTGNVTVATQSSQVLYAQGSSAPNSMVFGAGEPLTFVNYSGAGWMVAGGGNGGVGAAQTLQNMTGSRALNTNYTNSTGRPIQVIVTATIGGGSTGLVATVGGVTVYGPTVNSTAMTVGVSFIAPNGVTYSIIANAGLPTNATLQAWNELR